MTAVRNILIRGISTSGSDQLGLGRVRFGPMIEPLARRLRQQQVDVTILENLGAGSVQNCVDKAARFLAKGHTDGSRPGLHLIGHSMGGLVARALAHQPDLNVVAVTTLASPHRGARIAELAMAFKSKKPWLYRAFRTVGYDVAPREMDFAEFTSAVMREWNENFPDQMDVDYGSFQFSLPLKAMSPPVQFVGRQVPAFDRQPSDGYVELESQRWGRELGCFALDHLAQIGWNFQIWPPARRRTEREFQKFLNALVRRIQDVKNSEAK